MLFNVFYDEISKFKQDAKELNLRSSKLVTKKNLNEQISKFLLKINKLIF